MPFINMMTNVSLSKEKEQSLKAAFGSAIRLLPGNSEQWLMVGFEPEHPLWFQGTDAPAAMVDVSVFGGSDGASYSALTQKICSILQEELSLSPDRVYIKYSETDNWGWNGGNF